MLFNKENYDRLRAELLPFGAELIAVSKTKPVVAIQELYDYGQRTFAENYVQELTEKHSALPSDIEWHFIGHLQTNKVKLLSKFVSLIQGIDSFRLLQEVNKQAAAKEFIQDCLLQVHIAKEETKFGFSFGEIEQLVNSNAFTGLENIRLTGLMGMASNTDDQNKVRDEFKALKKFYDKIDKENKADAIRFRHLSMGMSQDYRIALEEGSNMIRIGSAIFGERNTGKL